MDLGYTETPRNFDQLKPYVITDVAQATKTLFQSEKCFFYDTCSFRAHANLKSSSAKPIVKYMKTQKGCVVIIRSILMELASHSGVLNQEYVQYIRSIKEYGAAVIILYEEDLFSILQACFSTGAAVSDRLIWSVRMLKPLAGPVAEVLAESHGLQEAVIGGKSRNAKHLFRDFFRSVRARKEPGDNLGESVLAVCLNLLTCMPGEPEGKFCMITDDKGAVRKIDAFFKRIPDGHRGKRIIVFSTPKLVQTMYREKMIETAEQMKDILGAGREGNIKILGTGIYDLYSREYSFSCEELAALMMTPDGINITF